MHSHSYEFKILSDLIIMDTRGFSYKIFIKIAGKVVKSWHLHVLYIFPSVHVVHFQVLNSSILG